MEVGGWQDARWGDGVEAHGWGQPLIGQNAAKGCMSGPGVIFVLGTIVEGTGPVRRPFVVLCGTMRCDGSRIGNGSSSGAAVGSVERDVAQPPRRRLQRADQTNPSPRAAPNYAPKPPSSVPQVLLDTRPPQGGCNIRLRFYAPVYGAGPLISRPSRAGGALRQRLTTHGVWRDISDTKCTLGIMARPHVRIRQPGTGPASAAASRYQGSFVEGNTAAETPCYVQ